MNTTTRFTIVDDLSWLTKRIILAGEQLLNSQGSALLILGSLVGLITRDKTFPFCMEAST